MSDIMRAITFATQAHYGGFRKEARKNGCPVPYIIHPIEVMKTLWNMGFDDQNSLVAAILHDVVEDTHITEEMLRQEFSRPICDLVVELTRLPMEGLSPEQAKREKANYLASFEQKSKQALLIKLVDRYCNILDFERTNKGYCYKYAAKAVMLYAAFANRREELVTYLGYETMVRFEDIVKEMKSLAARHY